VVESCGFSCGAVGSGASDGRREKCDEKQRTCNWGGWYDHIAPPNVMQWKGGGPAGYQGSQFRYGDKSDNMWGCFDFAAPPRLGVPSLVPK
jgi:hypothetical protein